MSRLIKTGSIAVDRKRLLQAVFLTVSELAKKSSLNSEEARDMVSFLVLSLGAIRESVEKTVAPWEKRDYWLKADQFRREWAWVANSEDKLRTGLMSESDVEIAEAIAGLVPRLSGIELPKRNKLNAPWRGAWEMLRLRGNPGN